ncbi:MULTISPECIES: YbaB/EbfC family nucleoid-associated protein [Clostridium]|uniref:YbaB/EbfC family nucleoid-associated protein n=1 Tax=Clostridium TaxID=1485 RepID=UPI000A26E87F|nr:MULTISPECIES: YbaB/EbfC family nucleoid-associated protein [Clostridium]MDU7339153.1 YbaB/EbfC family nucleoid-associated protein [Clostridium sp.]
MKARLPEGYGKGGAANLQQIARQAQKLQEEMDNATTELEAKEYTATSGGNAVEVVVTGKMEVKSITIKPEVVDPEDVEMLSDLIMAATNEALRAAVTDKNERMESLSGGLNVPGIF